MTFNDNLASHYANVEQSNIMNSFIKYYIDSELVALKNLVLDAPPETLDTLNELAAAIGDDPAFFSSMSAANTTLQTNIDNLQAAAQAARDLIQADVDANEVSAASALSTETSNREAAVAALQALVDAAQTARTAMQADIDQNESDADAADAALSARLDTLEADPTTATAVAAVQADVDQNESDSDAAEAALSARLDVLEADPTTAAAVAAVQADVDQNEADADAAIAVERNRIDSILASSDADKDSFAEIVTLINSVDTANDNAFAAYVLSNDAAVAAVQADVNQNESDSDAAEAALSARLDTLEADPTTAAAVAAVQADVDQNETDSDAAEAALSARLDTLEADPTTATAVAAVQADVDQNEADADAALALKAPLADPDFTGVLEVDTNARLEFDSNLTKVHNVLRGTSIVIGNNITLNPAAADGRVEVEGEFYLRPSDLTDAANDGAAAAAGVIVGQVYRNGSDLKIRVS
jgi:hypothetical protein